MFLILIFTVLLQGADNVFTQHTPLLAATLADFLTGQLDTDAYPFVGMSQVCCLLSTIWFLTAKVLNFNSLSGHFPKWQPHVHVYLCINGSAMF